MIYLPLILEAAVLMAGTLNKELIKTFLQLL